MIRPISEASDSSDREAGFTLIEALAAIVILAFGIIAVANLLIVAASSNQIGNLSTAAAVEASETMEKLKAIEFCTLRNVTASGTSIGSLTADLPATIPPPATPVAAWPQPEVVDAAGVPVFNSHRQVQGVGVVRTRWTISNMSDIYLTPVLSIVVESQVVSGPGGRRTAFGGDLSKAQFRTFRTCTGRGCPEGAGPCP
jgi:type II secretory pathway pseudopilin PulG